MGCKSSASDGGMTPLLSNSHQGLPVKILAQTLTQGTSGQIGWWIILSSAWICGSVTVLRDWGSSCRSLSYATCLQSFLSCLVLGRLKPLSECFPQTLVFTVLVAVFQSKLTFIVHNWNSLYLFWWFVIKILKQFFLGLFLKLSKQVIRNCFLFRILITAYPRCYSSVNTCIWLTDPILSFLGGTCPSVKEWFVYFGNPLKQPDLIQPVQPSVTGIIKMCINLNWKNHFTKMSLDNPSYVWYRIQDDCGEQGAKELHACSWF